MKTTNEYKKMEANEKRRGGGNTMRTRTLAMIGAAGIMAGVFLASGLAQAAVLEDADFGGKSKIEIKGGKTSTKASGDSRDGWRASKGGTTRESAGYIELDLNKVAADRSQGAMQFTIVRGNERGQDEESFFTVVDSQIHQLFGGSIRWEWTTENRPKAYRKHNEPHLMLIGSGVIAGYTREWGFTNSHDFPRHVGQGSEVTITITWGPKVSDNGVYIDGRRMKTRLRDGYNTPEMMQRGSFLIIGTSRDSRSVEQGFGDNMTSLLTGFKYLDTPTGDLRDVNVAVASVEVSAKAGFSGKLVAGNVIGVKATGTAGQKGTFDIGRLPESNGTIALDWRGWGTKRQNRGFVTYPEIDLHDVKEYTVYASTTSFAAVDAGMVPVETLEAAKQSVVLDELDAAAVYYVAVNANMKDGSIIPIISPKTGLAMSETAPGIYEGAYTVAVGDDVPKAVVTAQIASPTTTARLASSEELAIDSSVKIDVVTDPSVLQADEKSTANVTVTVTDANGDPVEGHALTFFLATTSEYTGVIGGGKFTDEVGGSMSVGGEYLTDMFGRIKAKYVAGFAAKTAIIVARDLENNDTGAGSVTTYIIADGGIKLKVPGANAMAKRTSGYVLTLETSDDWLTADGDSKAKLTATLTKNGVDVEGMDINFTFAPANGAIKVNQGTTDSNGKARAVYTAGKKIGVVVITASFESLTASVEIELRNDAPAKIVLKIDPAELEADGVSRADVEVLVTDINDNPADEVKVEFTILQGTGSLRSDSEMTDRRGEAATSYQAGRNAGYVVIRVTVRSLVPSDAELLAARDLAVQVADPKFF